MGQKATISLPSNVIRLQYNQFSRDFDGFELDLGTVRFVKDQPRKGETPLKCHYDTTQGSPFWYLMELHNEL